MHERSGRQIVIAVLIILGMFFFKPLCWLVAIIVGGLFLSVVFQDLYKGI